MKEVNNFKHLDINKIYMIEGVTCYYVHVCTYLNDEHMLGFKKLYDDSNWEFKMFKGSESIILIGDIL